MDPFGDTLDGRRRLSEVVAWPHADLAGDYMSTRSSSSYHMRRKVKAGGRS